MRGIDKSRDNKRSGQFRLMSNHCVCVCKRIPGRGSRTAGLSWSRAKTQMTAEPRTQCPRGDELRDVDRIPYTATQTAVGGACSAAAGRGGEGEGG